METKFTNTQNQPGSFPILERERAKVALGKEIVDSFSIDNLDLIRLVRPTNIGRFEAIDAVQAYYIDKYTQIRGGKGLFECAAFRKLLTLSLSEKDSDGQFENGEIKIDLDAYCTLGKPRPQMATILANVGKTFGHPLDAVLALAVSACRNDGHLPHKFVGKFIQTSDEKILIYAAHNPGIRIFNASVAQGMTEITTACAVKI